MLLWCGVLQAYQGVVLSAFFGGYAATQVLGGRLADTYGGKLVLTAGVTLWSLFTCITPFAASQGTASLLAARVLLGVGEGVAFPAIHSIIGEIPQTVRIKQDFVLRQDSWIFL
jgi:ACS family sodium-dependent inorganic phosphate cotransporter